MGKIVWCIFAVCVSGVLFACTGQMGGDGSKGNEPQLNSMRADATFKRFSKNNDHCQIWTDWQTMCSRTGRHGQTYCQIDPTHPVEPSEPFCVDEYLADPKNLSDKQIDSVLRFCDLPYEYDIPVKVDGKRWSTTKLLRLCAIFSDSRPFNGRSVSALAHPWCSEWSGSVTKEKVCKTREDENEIGGIIKTCSDVTIRETIHENPLVCSVQNLPKWCARASVHIGDPVASREEEIIYDYHGPLLPPVIGLRCTYTTKEQLLHKKIWEK